MLSFFTDQPVRRALLRLSEELLKIGAHEEIQLVGRGRIRLQEQEAVVAHALHVEGAHLQHVGESTEERVVVEVFVARGIGRRVQQRHGVHLVGLAVERRIEVGLVVFEERLVGAVP